MRYWIGVASKEHVQKGVEGSFAQVCHGKGAPLMRMKGGDWIIYYSPTIQFGSKEPYQHFTAVGKIKSQKPYTFQMSEDFIPWRHDVDFVMAHDVAIRPLLDDLSFILDKKRWGFPFRRGCFEISKSDFERIAKAMGVVW